MASNIKKISPIRANPLRTPSSSANQRQEKLSAAGGHIISVVGGKGGVGKSSFAANFALAMALDAKNGPALIDADPLATGDLNLILGIKRVKAYGDMLLQGRLKDGKALKQIMSTVTAGSSPLSVLQMSQNPERLLDEDEDNIELAFKLLRKTFPITIVDIGTRLESSMLRILDLSSLILVVTNPEILVLNQSKKIIEKLQTQLYPPQMTKIVLNKYSTKSPYNPQVIEQTLKRQLLGVIPEDHDFVSGALSRGRPFVAVNPQAAVSKAMFAMSRTVIEKRLLQQLAQINRPKKPRTDQSDNLKDFKKKSQSSSHKGPVDPRSIFKLRVHGQLIEKLDLKKEELNRSLDKHKQAELRNKALRVVSEILNNEDHQWKSRDESAQLSKEILDEALGLGPLENFLADSGVTEIMVNRADKIYIEKDGRSIESKTTFSSNQQLLAIIERIVNPLGRRIDEKTPYVDARLQDGSRVHAIIPPLALDGPMLTIRKFPEKRLGPRDLVKFKSMTPEMSDFLRACIEARLNVIISGGTGSGKTTLLNVMSNFIPDHERILTVEDSAELQLGQEHVGRLETRPANIEGSGEVSIRDLVKQTLRMRPDRIIIGEVRGGEALDMLQAMNTGHDGSMATVHSNSPRDCLSRIETLVMMAGMDLPIKAIRDQIAGAVDLIVQQSRLSDGSRKITYITEVVGMQGDVITTQDIFSFKQQGVDNDRKVIGRHMPSGFIPNFMDRIEAIGIKLPKGLFKAA